MKRIDKERKKREKYFAFHSKKAKVRQRKALRKFRKGIKALVNLEKAKKGYEKPGHKYRRRIPKGKSYKYEYRDVNKKLPRPGLGTVVVSKMPTFSPKDIESVYVGKPGHCMCGCSGKYYYASGSKKADRYGREANDKKVVKVLKRMKKHESKGVELLDGHIYTSVIGNTQYTLYRRRSD